MWNLLNLFQSWYFKDSFIDYPITVIVIPFWLFYRPIKVLVVRTFLMVICDMKLLIQPPSSLYSILAMWNHSKALFALCLEKTTVACNQILHFIAIPMHATDCLARHNLIMIVRSHSKVLLIHWFIPVLVSFYCQLDTT